MERMGVTAPCMIHTKIGVHGLHSQYHKIHGKLEIGFYKGYIIVYIGCSQNYSMAEIFSDVTSNKPLQLGSRQSLTILSYQTVLHMYLELYI